MQIKTILNRVQKFKSFVYGTVRCVDGASVPTLEVEIKARLNSRPVCSCCGCKRPGYDTLPERRFEFIPMWGNQVYFVYAPRRVECPNCGVRVEKMPWVEGKHRLTEAYAWFLAGWAKRLSWQEVAVAFRTTWDHVFCSVERAVIWGRKHQDLSGIEAILSSIYTSKTGRPSYPLLTLFRSLLLGLWYRLSDVQLAQCLYRDLLFRKFCHLELGSEVPEASTLGRFRNQLVKQDLWARLLGEINHQLEAKNIIMSEGRINIIDATPIEAAQSGSGKGKDGKPTRDPEAGWHVKNDSRGRKKSIYGFSVPLLHYP